MSVTGSTGGDPDLAVAAAGGQTFMDRYASIKAAIDMAQTAMHELGLGRAARAAYDEAESLKNAALSAITGAEEKAKDMLAEARAEADKIRAEATALRDQLLGHAHETVAAAEAAKATALTEAETLKRTAEETHATAKQVLADAEAKASDAASKLLEAGRLKDAADAAEQRAKDTVSKLHAAISGVMQELHA